MIELGNIIYESKKITSFYLCTPYMYKKETGLAKLNPEHPIRIVDNEGSYEQWLEMPRKLLKKRQMENDYQIYINALVNEYGYSLEEYPKSYIDEILEKDDFIELTKFFLERS